MVRKYQDQQIQYLAQIYGISHPDEYANLVYHHICALLELILSREAMFGEIPLSSDLHKTQEVF